VESLCSKIGKEETLENLVEALNSPNYDATQATAFLNDAKMTGQAPRHISSNINDNFGLPQLAAWKKLHTSGFETDFEYIRTLAEVPNYVVVVNGNSVTVSSPIQNNLTATFSGATITATGGTDGTNWNGILNVHPLIANANYIIESRYRYETDNIGRVIKVTTVIGTSLDKRTPARLKATTTQHARCQQLKGGTTNNAIPDDNDDAGHLIGSTFNGIGEQINLLPQVRKHNQPRNLPNGLWRRMEVAWDTNINSSVTVEITPIFIGNNRRPDRYETRYEYGGIPQTSNNNIIPDIFVTPNQP
jgi:hypothetical protein